MPVKFWLTLLVGASLLGFWLGHGQKEVQVIEKKVEVRVEGETKIKYQDRIVTVTIIKKPDGTVTETTTTKESSKDEHTNTSSTTKDKSTQEETKYSAQYSFGLSTHPSLDATQYRDWHSYRAEAGALLVGPLWGTISYGNKEGILLGLRVEL
jgi:hypothetical protein